MGASIAPFSLLPIPRPMPRDTALPPPFVDFRARLRCRYCGGGDVSTIVATHHATPPERWEQETGEDTA